MGEENVFRNLVTLMQMENSTAGMCVHTYLHAQLALPPTYSTVTADLKQKCKKALKAMLAQVMIHFVQILHPCPLTRSCRGIRLQTSRRWSLYLGEWLSLCDSRFKFFEGAAASPRMHRCTDGHAPHALEGTRLLKFKSMCCDNSVRRSRPTPNNRRHL